MAKNIYEFNAVLANKKEISLEEYQDKVVLVVNTASKCGFTPQYDGLEKIYQKYKDKGLVILAFPCNQFGFQEPNNEEQIQEFCKVNFGVTFPIFTKIDVNGSGAHPLYGFLKESLPGLLGFELIKWNFTKFLIDRNGVPVKRYAPNTEPKDLETDIEKLL